MNRGGRWDGVNNSESGLPGEGKKMYSVRLKVELSAMELIFSKEYKENRTRYAIS